MRGKPELSIEHCLQDAKRIPVASQLVSYQQGWKADCRCQQIADAKSAALRDKRIADAKKFYQYVITTHAEHELAPEAKKRLAALGKLVP